MTAPALAPDDLDLEASRLYDSAAWRSIVEGWPLTAPEPTPLLRQTAAAPILTKTAAQLEHEAGILYGPAPRDHQLPGRLAAILPDRLHTWRAVFMPDLKPSVQLGYARLVLEEWGWQNQMYKLRNARGARCICGGILSAQRLGYGTQDTAHRSAAFILTELRHQGWNQLIGPWNRAPGRTADQAMQLLTAAANRAAQAGH